MIECYDSEEGNTCKHDAFIPSEAGDESDEDDREEYLMIPSVILFQMEELIYQIEDEHKEKYSRREIPIGTESMDENERQ